MDIFDVYELDTPAVSKGVWGELVVGGQTIGRIRARPLDADINPEYRKAVAVAGIAYAALREKKLPEAEFQAASDQITAGVIADTILTDWEIYEKIKSGKNKGKERKIPFSKEKARDLLVRLPKFLAAVEALGKGWTSFRKGRIDETVKI